MKTNGEIVRDTPVGGGIRIEQTEGEIKPPLTELPAGAPPDGEDIEPKKITGKIPLSPAVVKPPLRLEGLVLAEFTGWNGWLYTEEELEEWAQLIAQMGIEMTPGMQVIAGLGTMHAARFIGFQAWRKIGKPGDTRRKKNMGELPKREELPNEEVKA